jgi:hypothetical protein
MQTAQVTSAGYTETHDVASGSTITTVVGVALFGLLIACTTTSFVRAVWPLPVFQVGIFLLVASYLLLNLQNTEEATKRNFFSWCIYLMPAWGVVQLVAHTTASSFDTRACVLLWASLAGVFYLSRVITAKSEARRIALNAFLLFATVMAVLSLAEHYTSEGQVLWLFPSGYPEIYGTFPSRFEATRTICQGVSSCIGTLDSGARATKNY